MVKTLKASIDRIKERLKEEECQEIKLGLYMALNSLKNDFAIEDESFLSKIGLDEELEQYL
jgi:hypothetical protein